MDGEEGGVAVSFRLEGEPWEGGDVEGTAKVTATPSSASPRKQSSKEKIILKLQKIKTHFQCHSPPRRRHSFPPSRPRHGSLTISSFNTRPAHTHTHTHTHAARACKGLS